jgi:hypothetical protein
MAGFDTVRLRCYSIPSADWIISAIYSTVDHFPVD